MAFQALHGYNPKRKQIDKLLGKEPKGWVCKRCKGTEWMRVSSKRYCKRCGWHA